MSAAAAATPMANPWMAQLTRITGIVHEAPAIATYQLAFEDDQFGQAYQFEPGQFNMLYLPGFGESAISISSDPALPRQPRHTVRAVGNVTRALARLPLGSQVGLRGPFGRGWPIAACRDSDVVLAAGGLGLPPLRSAIYALLAQRPAIGRIWLLYGARTPADLLFTGEFDAWRAAGIEVHVTVDRADAAWRGHIGVVPTLFSRLRLSPERTRVLTCGPEIMMRYVILEALSLGVKAGDIYLSMERNMNCAVGLCGHCQLGPAFICKDGPVFSYDRLGPYLSREDL
jgi:NAD(P)H-flavin reductase